MGLGSDSKYYIFFDSGSTRSRDTSCGKMYFILLYSMIKYMRVDCDRVGVTCLLNEQNKELSISFDIKT